jgi:competence protein ComEC
MLFPFLLLTLSLAAGILTASFLVIPIPLWLFFLLLSLFGSWIFFLILRKTSLSLYILLTAVFFLGASFYTSHNHKFEKNPIHNLRASSYIDFIGTLYKSPSQGLTNDYLYLRVEKIRHKNTEKKIEGNLRISIPKSPESSALYQLYVHDTVKVSAQLSSIEGFRNFGLPVTEQYLKINNIHNRAFSKTPLLVEKIRSGSRVSPLRWISIIRRKLQHQIEKHFPSPSSPSLSSQGAILEALLLGERGRMQESISRSLQNAGLFHLFAISGAHIAIISFLLFSLLKIVRIPNRLSYLILMFFLLFYTLLVEGRPSVIRAALMTFAFLLGKLLWKDVNLINTVSMSAFLLLIFNPFHIFSTGFLLTFAATYSIIIFFPKIIRFLPKAPLRISEIFALSLTAQAGVLPIIASTFNRVTFSALILNVLGLPLVGLIMACGYIFLPLSFLHFPSADLLAALLSYLVDLLIRISHVLDPLAFLSFRIPTPHWSIMILYYLFLLSLLIPLRSRRQRMVLLLCFLISFSIIITYPFSSSSEKFKITFIDVDQGDSILIEFPGKKKMLIDGGGSYDDSFDIGERVVSPFLWRKGIKKIDYMVLTHSHPDHMNGLTAVARNFRVLEFWEAFSPLNDDNYIRLKNLLGPFTRFKRIFRGDSLSINGVKVEILHPLKENSLKARVNNDHSLVLKLTHGSNSFLLTGDIEIPVERDILESDQNIRSRILKSPHHGSRSSSSLEFLERVMPEIIVISVGNRNTYGFPHQESLENYQHIEAEIYRTDHHGAVEIESDGYQITVKTAVPKILPIDIKFD